MRWRQGAVIVLALVWLGLSLSALRLALAGAGDGSDGAMALLSRELYATAAAVAGWLLGRGLPARSLVRRLSLVPVGITAALGVVALVAMLGGAVRE